MLATALLRTAKKKPRTDWTRASGNPILSAAGGWEANNTVQEPSVLYDAAAGLPMSAKFGMWYTGGYSTPGIGYAYCTSDDPTIPANWTKYASNPVLGQGGSGIAGWASGTSVFKFDSTYYCFYYNASGGSNLMCSTSSDGLAWNTPSSILAAGTPNWCNKYAADLFLWGSSGAWKMLVTISGNPTGGQPWQVAYATSSNSTPDSGWTVQGTGPLDSLRPQGVASTASAYGSLCFAYGGQQVNGRYYAWYHAGNGLLSNIFLAYSTDAQTWTPITDPFLQLEHDGGTHEPQQVADPSVAEAGGVSYLFYDGVDNNAPAGYINVATYPSTLADLVLWET